MRQIILTTYSLLFFFSTITATTTPQELFAQANEDYTQGQYQKAIDTYEAILATDNFSTEIYYNLGNAYFKTKQKGKAVLNFERALLANPSDEDAAYNLAILNQQLADNLDQVDTFFLKKWWQNFYRSASADFWSFLTLTFLWLGIGGLILWLLSKERAKKKQGFIGGIALLLLSLLFFFAARSQAYFEQNSQLAILVESVIDLRNGPDQQSTSILKIHEGLKVELLDQIDDWYKVKLSNGEQGWLPKESLEEI